MRPPLAQPTTLDFNKVWVVNPERGLALLGAAKAFSVKSPLSLDANKGELSIDLPSPDAKTVCCRTRRIFSFAKNISFRLLPTAPADCQLSTAD